VVQSAWDGQVDAFALVHVFSFEVPFLGEPVIDFDCWLFASIQKFPPQEDSFRGGGNLKAAMKQNGTDR